MLERQHLTFARPATEFEAHELDTLLGHSLLTSVKQGELIRRNAVAGQGRNESVA
ncbi:hypothetical protein ACHMW5_08400 (plasmid) [Azospirillum melinis]|uniref:hypothetical protein n=1 Tax=Azospirillum melinis TaxID=328839 RepID=UPI00375820DC